MNKQDYQIIDPAVFPDHVLREDIDECRFYTASGSYGQTWYKIKGLKGKRVQQHSHDYHFRCLKKDHPGFTVIQQTKPIVLAAAKTYLTAGGYVVRVIDDNCYVLRETSPGLNILGENITEANARARSKNGWQYKRDGSIYLNDEWGPKMKIIEELPFYLPIIPVGFEWAGGFPQFRVPVKGEYFMRYHSKTGFGDVVKCDGNFQVPPGEENRQLIVVPVPTEQQEVFVGEGYRRLGQDEYFNTSCECCKLSEVGTSQEKWAKVVWSQRVSNCLDYVFREKVVASQPKESVATQPQPLSTEGMVEVTHLKDYLVQKDDVYVERGKAHSASELLDIYPVSWYTYCEKLFATKKNYNDYVIRNSPLVDEGPVIGPGYRKIDPKIDTPQEGDQFWSKLNKQWLPRPTRYGNFSHIDTYRRLESSDYVILDPKIYGDHIPRAGDQYKKQDYTKWESMTDDTYKSIKHWAELGYVFRCKKANVPIVNTLPINDRADAAQISRVEACASTNVSIQVQENKMSNSSTNTETVKFETAKKLAVATAKLGGKMIWRTADYFVFAPIKKAASPFMWMVRYTVLGTAVGGGVYACTNPDDAKELLWKCVPKISISIDAPEVLG